MANKCSHCGKFLAIAEGAKCVQCASSYHRACVNINPDSRISPKWLCRVCKVKRNCPTKMCTPVQNSNRGPEGVSEDDNLSDTNLNEQNNSTGTVIQELRLLRQDILSMKQEMTSCREELARLRTTVAEFGIRVDTIEDRVAALERSEAEKRTNAQEPSDQIASLRTKLNDREQEYFLNDVEIACVQEKPGENTLNIVHMIATKISVELDERDIVFAERSGAHRTMHSQSGSDIPVRPRPIVVRLARRTVRDELLRAARVRRSIETSGIIDGETQRIYVNERLTPTNRHLFYKTREKVRNKGWRFAWTKGGKIYIRRNMEGPVHRIRTESDIARFFGDSPI